MTQRSRRGRRRPQLLAFPQHASSDHECVTDVVVSQTLRAIGRGRPQRPDYDQVHVAILQAIDEVRGVRRVRKGPWRVTAEHLRRWLLAREPTFVAAYPEFFDESEDVDEAELLAALKRCLPATVDRGTNDVEGAAGECEDPR